MTDAEAKRTLKKLDELVCGPPEVCDCLNDPCERCAHFMDTKDGKIRSIQWGGCSSRHIHNIVVRGKTVLSFGAVPDGMMAWHALDPSEAIVL